MYVIISFSFLTATCSKTITSKRKSDNPKKYMPSKQGKLSGKYFVVHKF